MFSSNKNTTFCMVLEPGLYYCYMPPSPMAEESEKLERGPQLETGGISLASPAEGTSLAITGHKLNGQNYTQSAKLVHIFLQGKEIEESITSEAKKLEKDEGCT